MIGLLLFLLLYKFDSEIIGRHIYFGLRIYCKEEKALNEQIDNLLEISWGQKDGGLSIHYQV